MGDSRGTCFGRNGSEQSKTAHESTSARGKLYAPSLQKKINNISFFRDIVDKRSLDMTVAPFPLTLLHSCLDRSSEADMLLNEFGAQLYITCILQTRL